VCFEPGPAASAPARDQFITARRRSGSASQQICCRADARTPARMMTGHALAADAAGPGSKHTCGVGAETEVCSGKGETLTATPIARTGVSSGYNAHRTGAEVGKLRLETTSGRAMWLFLMRYLLTTRSPHFFGIMAILRPPQASAGHQRNPVIRLNYYGSGKYISKVAGSRRRRDPASVESRAYAVHEGRQQTRRIWCRLRWPS